MPKETLVERMNQKRLDAKNASDKDVADYIWREIKWIFDLIDGYQLEQVDYLTVTVEEKVDSIKIDITVKESYEASDYTEECETVMLTAEKLERLPDIMPIVMEMAEQEEIRVWYDKDKRFWGFHIEFAEEEDQ